MLQVYNTVETKFRKAFTLIPTRMSRFLWKCVRIFNS